ncbi:hypothetical protein SEPCBS119000_003651 [Sporothrix epigloea]|uniref:Phosphoglycerate mutase family protein n=1 Tax=Sporothrix epigloea TaxID=1892477 RepID=A0ABP0DS13_9PEZI
MPPNLLSSPSSGRSKWSNTAWRFFQAFFLLAIVFSCIRLTPALPAITGFDASNDSPDIASVGPTVYMIRHGEKPDEGNGLDTEGLKRAKCLRTLFGASGKYNIGYVMAQQPKSNGKRRRPLDTVKPLARDLGLKVDTSCDRDDMDCVVKIITGYKGPGNILLCWEHERLTDIATALGVKNPPTYPWDSFDLIWTLPYRYKAVTRIKSEKCPKLDKR